jgi:hypothetical protein
LKQSLTFNFYANLSLPPCQVEQQEPPNATVNEKGKGRITFHLPSVHPSDNKIALRWKHRLPNRQMAQANRNALQVLADTAYVFTPAQLATIKSTKFTAHIKMYNHDNDELRCGVLDDLIPSAAANSGATSSVGTK